jgi:3-methyladenine DNA glycosylase AlkC
MTGVSQPVDENNLFRQAFSAEVVRYLAQQLDEGSEGFPKEAFLHWALRGLENLSFLDRAKHILRALELSLPKDFSSALPFLLKALGPEPSKDHLDGFEGFYIMPLTMYVSKNGLDEPDLSLEALYHMTKRFTAESDIRPFLIHYPKRTLAFLHKLTLDPSPFARRLASEGTRPRLPLASRLPQFQKDPSEVISLLDRLYTDPNLMVRRSVANNINDISKDQPETAVAVLKRWKQKNPSPELDWMIRHGLRTLIKINHPGALALLGYKTLGLKAAAWKLSPKKLALGDSLTFSFELCSTAEKEQKLAINYLIHFVKANGRTKPKVFRMPDKILKPNEVLTLKKTHKFLPFKNQSFYEGTHQLELVINGISQFKSDFYLIV